MSVMQFSSHTITSVQCRWHHAIHTVEYHRRIYLSIFDICVLFWTMAECGWWTRPEAFREALGVSPVYDRSSQWSNAADKSSRTRTTGSLPSIATSTSFLNLEVPSACCVAFCMLTASFQQVHLPTSDVLFAWLSFSPWFWPVWLSGFLFESFNFRSFQSCQKDTTTQRHDGNLC